MPTSRCQPISGRQNSIAKSSRRIYSDRRGSRRVLPVVGGADLRVELRPTVGPVGQVAVDPLQQAVDQLRQVAERVQQEADRAEADRAEAGRPAVVLKKIAIAGART